LKQTDQPPISTNPLANGAGHTFFGASAMLVRAHDGGVDHHVLVVVIAGQELENPREHAALGPSVEAVKTRS
jgi:hypothetical protein